MVTRCVTVCVCVCVFMTRFAVSCRLWRVAKLQAWQFMDF